MSLSHELPPIQKQGKYLRFPIEDGSNISFQGNEARVVELLVGGPILKSDLHVVVDPSGRLSFKDADNKTEKVVRSANQVFSARKSAWHIDAHPVIDEDNELAGYILRKKRPQRNEIIPNYTTPDARQVHLTPTELALVNRLAGRNRLQCLSEEDLNSIMYREKGKQGVSTSYWYNLTAQVNAKLKEVGSEARIVTRMDESQEGRGREMYMYDPTVEENIEVGIIELYGKKIALGEEDAKICKLMIGGKSVATIMSSFPDLTSHIDVFSAFSRISYALREQQIVLTIQNPSSRFQASDVSFAAFPEDS